MVSLTSEGYLPIRHAHKSKHEKYSGLRTIHTKTFKTSPAYLALKNKNSKMPEEISHTVRNADFADALYIKITTKIHCTKKQNYTNNMQMKKNNLKFLLHEKKIQKNSNNIKILDIILSH